VLGRYKEYPMLKRQLIVDTLFDLLQVEPALDAHKVIKVLLEDEKDYLRRSGLPSSANLHIIKMHKVIACDEYTRVKRLCAEVGLEAIVEGLSEHVSRWIDANFTGQLKTQLQHTLNKLIAKVDGYVEMTHAANALLSMNKSA